MNDRELHCRGKASEERAKARVAATSEIARRHLDAAKEWDREGDEAAIDHSVVAPLSESAANPPA